MRLSNCVTVSYQEVSGKVPDCFTCSQTEKNERQQKHPSYFRLRYCHLHTIPAGQQLPCNHSVMLGDKPKHQASKPRWQRERLKEPGPCWPWRAADSPWNIPSPDSPLNNVFFKNPVWELFLVGFLLTCKCNYDILVSFVEASSKRV